MALSESDIKQHTRYSSSLGTPGCPDSWLNCPKQQVGRSKSFGERGVVSQSFHGAADSLEISSSLSRKNSNEEDHVREAGQGQGLFSIMEAIPARQRKISPRGSICVSRCSQKISQRETWRMGESFSDSEPDESLGWQRMNQERRHSFKCARSKRLDIDGYEPEELDSSQSSMATEMPRQLVHSRTEDWDLLHSIQTRRLSTSSVM